MREELRAFLERPSTTNVITGVIVFNAIILGLETSKTITDATGPVVGLLDTACLAIFIAELLAKLYAYGWRFWRSAWNVFDFIIIGIAIMPGADGLSVLRALRILRVLRLVSTSRSLRTVIEGFFRAVPGMANVFALTMLVFYIFSVMATKLFAETFPDWFGSIGGSAYSLFQIMTLESWSMGIVRPVMDVHGWAWAFFVPFILMTSFAILNVIVGLIVNSMSEAADAQETPTTDAYRDEVLSRLAAIEAKLTAADGGTPPTQASPPPAQPESR